MTLNKQHLKHCRSAAVCAGLIVALMGQSAAISPLVSTIPIFMTVSAGSVTSGGTLNCTVTVASVPANGRYVLINCDTPSAFTSPDGNWPTSINFDPGSSTTASFTLTANSVSGTTNVNLSYGTSDADPDDPDDWTAGGAVTVEAGG
jgi:hypothetical protein